MEFPLVMTLNRSLNMAAKMDKMAAAENPAKERQIMMVCKSLPIAAPNVNAVQSRVDTMSGLCRPMDPLIGPQKTGPDTKSNT